MHRIGIASFTDRGAALADRLEIQLGPGCEVMRCSGQLRQWCRECFALAEGIIFIGACGIAVRTIAPFLKSKTTDPAVLVIDEAGRFVISLLSGHIGGANEFALKIAEKIGAVPVITTASDVSGTLAVDVFAKKNGLTIGSMQDAKEIAAALLRKECVFLCCSGQIEGSVPPELSLPECARPEAGTAARPECARQEAGAAARPECARPEAGTAARPECARQEAGAAVRPEYDRQETGTAAGPGNVPGNHADCRTKKHMIWISEAAPPENEVRRILGEDGAGTKQEFFVGTVLHLIPRSVVLGVGCRRGRQRDEIRRVTDEVLRKAGIPAAALCMAASIDLKKDEPGLQDLCRDYGIPLVTYPAKELMRAEGNFETSEFVRRTTGADNVCERAAVLAAGAGGRLIWKKYAENGVTVALALRKWRVCFEK